MNERRQINPDHWGRVSQRHRPPLCRWLRRPQILPSSLLPARFAPSSHDGRTLATADVGGRHVVERLMHLLHLSCGCVTAQAFTPPPITITCKSGDSLDHIEDGSIDVVVMDPPYYDNVMYAELSDFFYVWLKRTAGHVFPELFRRQLTDKDNEAVANPARFQGQKGAKALAGRDYQARMASIFAECRRTLERFSNRPCTTWGGRGTSARTDAGGLMRAYSMDLRERVLLDSDAGMKAADVAAKYRVSGSWVRLLKQRRRDTGEVAPRVQRHGRRCMLEPHLHTLADLIAAQPDRTLAELKDALATPARVPTVWRAVRALGLTVKKNGPPVRTRSA